MRAELEHVKAHNITELDEHTESSWLDARKPSSLKSMWLYILLTGASISWHLTCLLSGASSLSRLIRHWFNYLLRWFWVAWCATGSTICCFGGFESLDSPLIQLSAGFVVLSRLIRHWLNYLHRWFWVAWCATGSTICTNMIGIKRISDLVTLS